MICGCGEIGRRTRFRQRYYIAKIPAAAQQVKFEQKIKYASMAELADALDLGSSGRPCRFDSCYSHQRSAEPFPNEVQRIFYVYITLKNYFINIIHNKRPSPSYDWLGFVLVICYVLYAF